MTESSCRYLSGLVFALGSFSCGACSGENPSTDGEPPASSGGMTGTGGAAATGGAGSGGGAVSGSGGSSFDDDYESDDFSLTEEDGVYALVHGDVTMTVDPQVGGRISGFTVEGAETLVQEGEAPQYGSTFWPSPQIWSWPPEGSIGEIDPEPYSVNASEQRLILTSENNGFLGAIVTKTFAPVESGANVLGLSVTYSIENTNASPLAYAAWEISRVSQGVAFYPQGPGGVLLSSTLMPHSALGHGWYEYDASGLDGVPKLFADGAEGWLAWAMADAGAIVVKSFPDIPASSFAMGEAEIEIYADPSGDYMEVEQQGPAVLLGPGEILTWRVEWYGARLPEGTTVEPGNQALVDAVTAALGL